MWCAGLLAATLSLLLGPVALAAPTHKSVYSKAWDSQYDGHFRKYTKRYFGPNIDWHWFKAQGIAESSLRPNAKSSAGARGIMQILPSTYEEIRQKNPHFKHIDDPRWNIAAAIYYDRKMYKKWQKRLHLTDARLAFTFASYNAGYGNISKAHRAALKSGKRGQAWKDVAPHSPRETRRYVRRITTLMTP